MDFDSFEDAIAYIKKVDNSEELFASYFNEFPIHTESKLKNITEENIISFFNKILRNNKNSLEELDARSKVINTQR
jgi:hypothetical protein